MSTADAWAWAHDLDAPEEPLLDAATVAALLVVHRPGRWLGRTLVALDRLEHRPGRLVAVLNDQDDPESLALLEKARSEGILDEVLVTDAQHTPGRAWALAEQALDGQLEWLWLLHDDSEPQRTALDELRRLCATDDAPDLVFPKLLEPIRRNHPDRVAEFGQSVTTSGGRLAHVEAGELDQHHLEGGAVLGGSTAGMFIRRSAWQRLGGMDEAYPLHRDGLDLGWRANRAGLVVVTCPEAAVHHRRAGRQGERDSALASSPEVTDRLLGMRLVQAHSAHPRIAFARLMLWSLLGAIGLLLAKNPSLAGDRLRAAHQLWRTRAMLPALRERAVAAGDADVSSLLPTRTQLLLGGIDRAASAVTDRFTSDDEGDTDLDDLTGDDFAGGRRRVRVRPAVVALSLLVALGVAAGRRLLTAGALAGPSLLPAPRSLAAAWDAWARPVAGVGGIGSNWLALQALGSTLALGRPDWFGVLQQVLAVPLAVVAALPLLRRRRGERGASSWTTMALASLWGLALPLAGISARGSIGALQLSVLLPLAGWALLRWWQIERSGLDAARDAALFALALTGLCGVTPAWWLVGLACAVVVARHHRQYWTIAIVALGPLVGLAGWLPQLAAQPARLVTGTDPLVLVDPVRSPLAVVVLVLAAALAVWLRPARSTSVLLAVAAVPLALGTVAPRGLLHLAGAPVRADGDGPTLLGLGLLVLALARVRMQRVVAALLAVALLATGTWWVLAGASGVGRRAAVVPAHVTAVQASNRATRALLVDLSTRPATWQLTSADRPRWGTAERPVLPEPLLGEVERIAQDLASGTGSDDLASRAAALGIAHLWVRGATAEQVAATSNGKGLSAAEASRDNTTWTVTGLVSDAQLVSGSGAEATSVPVLAHALPKAVPAGSRLVLAQPADSRWRASVDGQRLQPTEAVQGRQAFQLPEGVRAEAPVEWSMRPAWGWIVLELVGLLALVLLAAPSRTTEVVRSPRRSKS